MPADRLTMRKIREILRLRWGVKLSGRATAKSCNVSPSTVTEYIGRAQAAGLSWPLAPELDDDAALEALLFPDKPNNTQRITPDFPYIYRELKRDGVTLMLLWIEYHQNNEHSEHCYQYSQFCELYRNRRQNLELVMHQQHKAGEKLFVDYAGQTIPIIDPQTGASQAYQLFVATFGASSYTYVEVHKSQTLENWCSPHIRAFEFFRGVPQILVPDNLKAGVKSPCFYEPELNPTYQELAKHYDCVVIPARVLKSKDKAKVENGVLQAERWILAPLRNQTFFSRQEAVSAIQERLTWLNNRPLSQLDGTRASLFEEIDKPALKPLSPQRYELAHWKSKVGVNIDYHICFEKHYYSVPYQLVRKRVEVRATQSTVELFFNNQRVASHLKSNEPGRYTTDPSHRPASHQSWGEWSPERLVRWAHKMGPNTVALLEDILERKPHVEQGFRACLGILRLADSYGSERLEKACQRARYFGMYNYRSVSSILKSGLEQQSLQTEEEELPPLDHENIRGPHYYN